MTTTTISKQLEESRAGFRNTGEYLPVSIGDANGGLYAVWHDGNRWFSFDIDSVRLLSAYGVALVTIESGCDADDGLNQAALAMDLDDAGQWLVDLADLDDLTEIYGDKITVLWKS